MTVTPQPAPGGEVPALRRADGTPIRVMMVRAADPEADERRAKALAAHIEQIKCRQKADTEGVLPRDRTDFILKCMDE